MTVGLFRRAFTAGFVFLTSAALGAPSDARDPAASATAQQQENTPYNGQFIFARLRYRDDSQSLRGFGRFRGRGGDPGWHHDYPVAEYNLMQIFSSITTLRPGSETGNIVEIGDPDLHKYPVAYMSEPGFWTMDEKEVENMRSYLLKGGFLIFDDFPEEAWQNFSIQMQRLLPGVQPVVLEPSHEIFHAFFDVDAFERLHYSYRGRPIFVGYFEDNDERKRLLAIANYRNDLGENWEWAATGFEIVDSSNEAFKFGVNYILYGMTH